MCAPLEDRINLTRTQAKIHAEYLAVANQRLDDVISSRHKLEILSPYFTVGGAKRRVGKMIEYLDTAQWPSEDSTTSSEDIDKVSRYFLDIRVFYAHVMHFCEEILELDGMPGRPSKKRTHADLDAIDVPDSRS